MEVYMNDSEYPSGFLPPLPTAWHFNLATAYFGITLGCELQLKAEICRPYHTGWRKGEQQGLVPFLTITVDPLLLYSIKAK